MKMDLLDLKMYLKDQLNIVEPILEISPEIAENLVEEWCNFVMGSGDVNPEDAVECLTELKDMGYAEEAMENQIGMIREYGCC
jgi:hypothetical protein